MGKVYDGIDNALAGFIAAQHVFFVATAPLDRAGYLNLSPKGLDSFRVIDPKTVAYLDLTGSGIETLSHLRENRRIVILFCAFEGPPKLLRLYGRGDPVEPGDPRFEDLRPLFPNLAGVRSVIVVELDRIADSCGYGVPLYSYEGERTQLLQWAKRKGPNGLAQYRAENNRLSIDGMPGLRLAPDNSKDSA
ncbi:MAG: pyridoxamine 5'-phosphate oxidase family protein [Candidatus Binataceae bacterium]